jgi:hypothetical protein
LSTVIDSSVLVAALVDSGLDEPLSKSNGVTRDFLTPGF